MYINLSLTIWVCFRKQIIAHNSMPIIAQTLNLCPYY